MVSEFFDYLVNPTADMIQVEMDVLGEKILDKDEKTGNRRGNYHTALWVLKERVDELTKNESEDTKVSK